MRSIEPDFLEHLKGETTTLCTCWILRRTDGVVLGFTDHDESLTIENVSCEAATGFQPTEAVGELGLSVDNQEIEGALDSASIDPVDLRAGRYDNARVEVWHVNWARPSQRHHMRTAVLGEVSQEDHLFRAELRGLTALLDQPVGRTYSRRCDAQLGDARCGVDLEQSGFTASGSVVDVTDRLNLRCVGLEDFQSGWFAHGRLTWTGGKNAGQSVVVGSFVASARHQIALLEAMPFLPQSGDTFNVTVGCDKRFKTCRKRFSNSNNFRGFPHIPGSDFSLGYADAATVHDGSPLVD